MRAIAFSRFFLPEIVQLPYFKGARGFWAGNHCFCAWNVLDCRVKHKSPVFSPNSTSVLPAVSNSPKRFDVYSSVFDSNLASFLVTPFADSISMASPCWLIRY